MSAWQDISTAPKDGTYVLLRGTQRPHMYGTGDELTHDGPLTFVGYWDPIDEAWCSVGSLWNGPFYDPTHWMPLPDPPS